MTWKKCLLIVWMFFAGACQVQAGDSVLFLYDTENRSHSEFAQASERILREVMPEVSIRHVDLGEKNIPTDDGDRVLLISMGAIGASRAVQIGYPTLNMLITRERFEARENSSQIPVSAIYLEQPLIRQLLLIKSALPSTKVLTVFFSRKSKPMFEELSLLSRSEDMILNAVELSEADSINRFFEEELPANSSLLLLPDPLTVNRVTIKPLVMGSYHQRVPLIGYSQALVKAGALMAVHSTSDGLQKEMQKVVRRYFASGLLPAPRYADEFEVSVNFQLARALDLSIPSERNLKSRLQEQLR